MLQLNGESFSYELFYHDFFKAFTVVRMKNKSYKIRSDVSRRYLLPKQTNGKKRVNNKL